MLAPDFWDGKDICSRLVVAALSPIGWIYGFVVALQSKRMVPFRAPVPVVCVGNLTAGGTGKTPIAAALFRRLKARGKNPFFLTRGYGGKLSGPIRVTASHRAVDVGDEALLLLAAGPVVVAHDRAAGARLAVADGADVIVMDDGYQNFTLHKDLSLVVVDAAQKFGNGRLLPAGPLREFVRFGLKRADGVIVAGKGEGEVDLKGFKGPVMRVRLTHADMPQLKGTKVVGFAGIGRPEKFFASLEECGADIVARKRFSDHHVYSHAEIARLKAMARERDALLVTTRKDYVRLTRSSREGLTVLPATAVFGDPAAMDALLDKLVEPA